MYNSLWYTAVGNCVRDCVTVHLQFPMSAIHHPVPPLLQDVLLEHQMHVGKVFNQKLSDQSSSCGAESDSSTNTPTDIRDLEEKEYGLESKGHFNFPSN